jgi:hypothetical protein
MLAQHNLSVASAFMPDKLLHLNDL